MGPLTSSTGLCNEACHSALWLPLDLFLEDAMETTEVITGSAIEIITGKKKKIHSSKETCFWYL